ncbi:MAG: hypothetical protein SGPRY_000959 [Prymnesium sp.]
MAAARAHEERTPSTHPSDFASSHASPHAPRPSSSPPPSPHASLFAPVAGQTQREVNAGVRCTFRAVHSTLRSQGASVRGLEELIKRLLPEVDRIKRELRGKAEEAELARVGASADAAERRLLRMEEESLAQQIQTQRSLDAKCDLATGRRALELAQRSQEEAGGGLRLKDLTAASAKATEGVSRRQKELEEELRQLQSRFHATEARVEGLSAEERSGDGFRAQLQEVWIRLEAQEKALAEAQNAVMREVAVSESGLKTEMSRQKEALGKMHQEVAKSTKAVVSVGGLSVRLEKREREWSASERKARDELSKLERELSEIVRPQIDCLEAQQASQAQSCHLLKPDGQQEARTGVQQQLSLARSSMEEMLFSQLATLQALISSRQEKTATEVAELRDQLASVRVLARQELRHQGEAQADLHDAKEEWREWRAQAVVKLEAASHAGTTQALESLRQEVGGLSARLHAQEAALGLLSSRQAAAEERVSQLEEVQAARVPSHLREVDARLRALEASGEAARANPSWLSETIKADLVASERRWTAEATQLRQASPSRK